MLSSTGELNRGTPAAPATPGPTARDVNTTRATSEAATAQVVEKRRSDRGPGRRHERRPPNVNRVIASSLVRGANPRIAGPPPALLAGTGADTRPNPWLPLEKFTAADLGGCPARR